MRIELYLTPNKEVVPYNYQQNLVGAFHKWLGKNELHDDISLYSLSWLQHLGQPKSKTNKTKTGLEFPYGAKMSISSPLSSLHQQAVSGIFKDKHIRWGMMVKEVRMIVSPLFEKQHRFIAQSPILIKRSLEDQKHHQYFYHTDKQSSQYLTETLHRKLEVAGVKERATVKFDSDYRSAYIKMIKYKGLDIKGSMCPVIVEGDPRAVQFAWEVGVGNSTGIGFGALR